MKHGSGNSPKRRRRILTISTAIIAVAAIAVGVSLYDKPGGSTGPLPVQLPATPQSYLGVYADGAPASYAGVTAFTNAIGARPDVVMYYSGWYVPFPVSFATTTAINGAVPLVQMDPDSTRNKTVSIALAGIASGQYDGYLTAYAEAVRAYRHPVILSFGHEMNGSWSTWGYTRPSPATFVLLGGTSSPCLLAGSQERDLAVDGQHRQRHAACTWSPAPWWPGSSYVTWVGIDGYYLKPSWQFAPLFGPTIAEVHALTSDPILIAETGATPAAGQPAKIADMFAGIRAYGLLGFVWFDSANSTNQDFRINSPAAFTAFHTGASTFTRPGS